MRLFASGRAALPPASIQATIKRLLAPAPRLLVVGPQPLAGGPSAATAALAAAAKTAGGVTADLRSVSLDELVLKGNPATAAAPDPITPLGAERVRFSNGVELVFKHTDFEKNRVRVRVEIGSGVLGEPRNRLGLWWTASALPAAGLGPFNAEELSRVIAGRPIGFQLAPALDGLSLAGITNAGDLAAMLKLMTGEIVAPRFDAVTINRLREASLANYASVFSQPLGVFQAFSGAALHGGDTRFDALPSRDAIAALTLPDFQRFWTDRLARGPVKITVVGDVDRPTVVAAIAGTLGTLAPRNAAKPVDVDVRATAPAAPVVLRHQGDPGQALIIRAWPTLGQIDDRSASAALDLAASIVQTGLIEGFRAAEGGSYTPIAAQAKAGELLHYGVFLAGAQVQTAQLVPFGRALDGLIADLATKGPDPDAFARAQATAISATERSREDNGWWLGALSSDLTPTRVAALAEREADLKALTPAKVKDAVKNYLGDRPGFSVQVLPEAAALK